MLDSQLSVSPAHCFALSCPSALKRQLLRMAEKSRMMQHSKVALASGVLAPYFNTRL